MSVRYSAFKRKKGLEISESDPEKYKRCISDCEQFLAYYRYTVPGKLSQVNPCNYKTWAKVMEEIEESYSSTFDTILECLLVSKVSLEIRLLQNIFV